MALARRTLLAAALVPLLAAGCDLRPVHGGSRGPAVNRELAAVTIDEGDGRLGQTLREYLIDELNPAGVGVPPLYALSLKLDRSQNALAIQLDDVATRFNLGLAVVFELKGKADGKTLYRSAVRRVASYNVRDEPFATQVAERDAERRAARELARQIRTQLSLYFARTAGR